MPLPRLILESKFTIQAYCGEPDVKGELVNLNSALQQEEFDGKLEST